MFPNTFTIYVINKKNYTLFINYLVAPIEEVKEVPESDEPRTTIIDETTNTVSQTLTESLPVASSDDDLKASAVKKVSVDNGLVRSEAVKATTSRDRSPSSETRSRSPSSPSKGIMTVTSTRNLLGSGTLNTSNHENNCDLPTKVPSVPKNNESTPPPVSKSEEIKLTDDAANQSTTCSVVKNETPVDVIINPPNEHHTPTIANLSPPPVKIPLIEITPPPIANEKYAKFTKMLKMLPEGAVRQKMMQEGCTEEEINNFFKGDVKVDAIVPKPQEVAPLAEPPLPPLDEKYIKYDKMLKMLPEGAVRQKMITDGLKPAEIDSFFNRLNPTPLKKTSNPSPPILNEKFAKYDKMRSMLPEAAVKQKMMQDGISPADIASFFGGKTDSKKQ